MDTNSPVLVTGAAGFIGARFVEACGQRKIPVISVDLLRHFDERTEHVGVSFGTKIDREKLFDWLEKEQPTLRAVVHLGACSDTTQLDVDFLRKVNVQYSQKIWNYCTEKQIPLVYASSAATYGAGEQGYEDDESIFDLLKPLNPYGDSKRLFDLWVLEQEKAGRTPPAWSGFKFFNVYGFGERHKNKMSSVVLQAYDQILKSGRVKLFKSYRSGTQHGHQRRDFIWVDDVIKVLLHAAGLGRAHATPISRGIYNLGTGQARSFLDLVNAAFAALDQPAQIDFIEMPEGLRERYQYFTEASMNRLRAQGFGASFTPLEIGVARTIERLQKGR